MRTNYKSKGIGLALQTQGIYIHYKKENWEKTRTDNSFMTDYALQRAEATSHWKANRDPELFKKIKEVLDRKTLVDTSLKDIRQQVENFVSGEQSLMKQEILEGMTLNNFLGTDSNKLASLIKGHESQLLDNLVTLSHYIAVNTDLNNMLASNKIKPIFEGQLYSIQSGFDKLNQLIGKMSSDGYLPVEQIAEEAKSFIGTLLVGLRYYKKDIMNSLGQLIKDEAQREHIKYLKGKTMRFTPSGRVNLGRPSKKPMSVTKVGNGAMISLKSHASGRTMLNAQLEILEMPSKFTGTKQDLDSYSWEDELSYDEMFNTQANDYDKIQNWFVNYYVHESGKLRYNSKFSNFLISRAANEILGLSNFQFLFLFNNKLYTIQELLSSESGLGLLQRYMRLDIKTSKVPNKWVTSHEVDQTPAALKRSHETYQAIRESAQFYIYFHSK